MFGSDAFRACDRVSVPSRRVGRLHEVADADLRLGHVLARQAQIKSPGLAGVKVHADANCVIARRQLHPLADFVRQTGIRPLHVGEKRFVVEPKPERPVIAHEKFHVHRLGQVQARAEKTVAAARFPRGVLVDETVRRIILHRRGQGPDPLELELIQFRIGRHDFRHGPLGEERKQRADLQIVERNRTENGQ